MVIPARDRERWIGRAIESALGQTEAPGEVIVVDDGSTDGTADVARSFGSRVRLIEQSASGGYVARNRAIAESHGAFIAFLDSDDVWNADKLQRQMPLFASQDIGVVFGDATIRRWEGTSSRVLPRRFLDSVVPGRGTAHDFVFGYFVPFSSAIVRRRCFDESGPFPVGRMAGDYPFFFRLALSTRFAWLDEPVFEYSVHDENWSGSYGRSLAARLAHFEAELLRTTVPEHRRLIEHLTYNLELHRAIARLRGKIGRNEGTMPPIRPVWLVEFALHQLRLRIRAALRVRRRDRSER